MKKSLRITKHNKGHLLIEGLIPKRFTHYGFGTFLENANPKEIEMDKYSHSVFMEATEKDGLNGVEVWKDNRIAWGDSSLRIVMPIEEISVMSGAKDWLKNVCIKKVKKP